MEREGSYSHRPPHPKVSKNLTKGTHDRDGTGRIPSFERFLGRGSGERLDRGRWGERGDPMNPIGYVATRQESHTFVSQGTILQGMSPPEAMGNDRTTCRGEDEGEDGTDQGNRVRIGRMRRGGGKRRSDIDWMVSRRHDGGRSCCQFQRNHAWDRCTP